MKGNIMSVKSTYAKVKARTAQLLDEHPLETIAVAAVAAGATAKLINSITEARKVEIWKREVQRREQKLH
jgi:hypothetical protein